jgi:hypothetical protein
MRPNSVSTISAADASVNQAGPAVPAQNLLYVAAQCVSTGSATGSVQLQTSNDQPKSLPVDANGNAIPVNWSNFGTAAAITAASVIEIAVGQVCANYVRALYTKTNGSAGTITVNLNTQGF